MLSSARFNPHQAAAKVEATRRRRVPTLMISNDVQNAVYVKRRVTGGRSVPTNTNSRMQPKEKHPVMPRAQQMYQAQSPTPER
jgi:hypothetical protein